MQGVLRTWQRRDVNATGLNNVRAPLLLQLRVAGRPGCEYSILKFSPGFSCITWQFKASIKPPKHFTGNAFWSCPVHCDLLTPACRVVPRGASTTRSLQGLYLPPQIEDSSIFMLDIFNPLYKSPRKLSTG